MEERTSQAFVTVATDDNYAMGALALGYSLRRVHTKNSLVILITPNISSSVRSKLKLVYDELREVDILDSKDTAHLSLMQRPELGKTFTKLHIWKLLDYTKCVFLDADTLVCQNCDDLFEKKELSAAPDVGWPDCFNTGVFVFVPSMETFQNLMTLAMEKGSFDGGDQGLLNEYFDDWATKDIEKHLSFIYNMVVSSSYTYIPAYKHYGHNVRIVHFLGSIKPWMHNHLDSSGHFEPCESCFNSVEHLKLWWEIYSSHPGEVSPEEEVHICSEISKVVLDEGVSVSSTSTTTSIEPSPRNRQECWEKGQIDYLGEDSFDNIQRKLEEAINGSKK